MPRSSAVSEKVWAQAIHAVTVQKMSLRRAAQLYGVHHMSLHRRVRGRYVSPAAARYAADFRLSRAEEAEAASVLREQFEHEQRVTSDDVRYVVRTIAGQSGTRRDLPADFPRKHWVADFKRAHGLGGASPSDSLASSESSVGGVGDDGMRPREATTRSLPPDMTSAVTSKDNQPAPQPLRASIRDEQLDETSESDSEHQAMEVDSEPPLATRFSQSSTVTDETWEKAVNAVEVEGMSLRNAAKAHGVHFAALHRRVKKRALVKQTAAPLDNYIPFEDEAGIVRVIRARADMGVLMTYEELVDLLNRTALKHAPSVSYEFSRLLARKFQMRVEQSIRHLVRDWPLPPLDAICPLRAPLPSIVVSEKLASPLPPLQRAALPGFGRSPNFPDPLAQTFFRAGDGSPATRLERPASLRRTNL